MRDNPFDIFFILLHISFILTSVMLFMTASRKDKTQLHYIFMLNMGALLIWTLGQILEVYSRWITGNTVYLFVYIYFFGVIFLPPLMMYLGIIYNKRKIKISFIHVLVFIPSVISYIILITRPWHNWFLITYSPVNDETLKFGFYFFIHNIITYIYLLIGMIFLFYTSLKSSGFFSRQSIMIFSGIAIPIVVNVLSSYRIIELPTYVTPMTFSVMIVLFMLSILRYDFLNVMPVSLKNIFDQITDGVIILDEKLKVLDYNNAAENIFKSGNIILKRTINLKNILNENILTNSELNRFYLSINKTVTANVPYSIEKDISTPDGHLHLSIEISNVIVKNTYYSTVMLIKDITELRNQMEEIQRSQEILREKERLASLGNLIGGIAHNLKTPIMTISGVSKNLEVLGEEYLESIDDPEVTDEDHREIARDIIEWAKKISPYCSYMSEMISAVKGQAVQLSENSSTIFTLYELLSRINILMKFELKKFHCELHQDNNASIYTELKGDLSILVQVFNNIITNAIQSYNGKEGIIDFKIYPKNGKIQFIISDNGVGIPDNIKEKLFRQMVTTKGKDGTGLGLYMAHSTIRGHFDGTMRFESEVGKGTTFFIEIPVYREVPDEAKQKE